MSTIGERNRPLQIQRLVTSTDSEGGPQENWTSIGRVYAAVQPLTAQESLIAAEAGVQITHLVTVGYRPDLAAYRPDQAVLTGHNLRLLDGTRVLDLVSQPIDLDSRRIELQIQCRELLQN